MRTHYDIVITVSAELKAWIEAKAKKDHRSERGTVVYLLHCAMDHEVAQAAVSTMQTPSHATTERLP